MRFARVLAVVLALCMVLSLGAFASSDMPDTSKGGSATDRPPDNSTKAVDVLGGRAALYFEYGEDGYTVSSNLSDDYAVEGFDGIAAPVIGQENALAGIYIYCGAEAWDEENAVGNSGIVINDLTDTETTWRIGGEEDVYEAPDGNMYNSVIIMEVDENEELASGATETAPGTGVAFNGKSLELKNVYMSSEGSGRPTVHIPASTRDQNVSQLSDIVVVDSMFWNRSTRAFLLMGGDVWFLNSTCLTNSWGALSYDNTSTMMHVVNSDAENVGIGGYAIYDAAGCSLELYGSRVVAGNTGITICRTADAVIDSLENAAESATAPYDGEAELLVPAATADGRSEIIAYQYPFKLHADMSGADSVASGVIRNAYISTLVEDVVFADGTTIADHPLSSSGISRAIADYVDGALVYIACHNGSMEFDNCELVSRTGVLVHSMFTYDSMASGIYPQDGVEYAGDTITLKNLSAEGDILHEDYMRKMVLSLENAELSGRVVGTTLAAWNNYWTDYVNSMPSEELNAATDTETAEEATLKRCIYNDSYETVWGVRMSMDADSVWTVTGDSNLYSFTMADGAEVKAPAGASLAIYVNCAMDNSLESYDIASGTRIDAFEPGVEYAGVVILVEEGGASGGAVITLGLDELGMLGIETYVDENGALNISFGTLLDALGVEMSYDEETGVITVTDGSGAVGGLLGSVLG